MWHGNIIAVGEEKEAQQDTNMSECCPSNYGNYKVAFFLIHKVVVFHRLPVKDEK